MTSPEKFKPGKAVKGRNEPCALGGVAWVVHSLLEGVTLEQVSDQVWRNTVDVFKLGELEEVLVGAAEAGEGV